MKPRLTDAEREVLHKLRKLSAHYWRRQLPERALSGSATLTTLVEKGYVERLTATSEHFRCHPPRRKSHTLTRSRR